MSYHIRQIKKGTLGQKDKIEEEFYEWLDASEQKCAIMELVELSDLLGAIKYYVSKNYNMSLDDLIIMNNITERVFKSGHRN